MTWLPTKFRRPSGIGLRLLAFNLLVVFVPVIGVLYLDVYESQLRQVQEAGLAQQARVLAAVLGDSPAPDAGAIANTFARLEHRSEARLRVYDLKGTLIADSAREPAGTSVDPPSPYASTTPTIASAGGFCIGSASGWSTCPSGSCRLGRGAQARKSYETETAGRTPPECGRRRALAARPRA